MGEERGVTMAKAVRMADIALRMGVSTVTVSKALADKDGVSEEMRAKIKQLAQEMGYKGPAAGKAMAAGSTGNVGVLISSRFLDKDDSFYWKMYERVVSRLMAVNYYGILEILRPEEEEQQVLPRVLQDQKADGLIVIGQISPAYQNFLRQQGKTPMMFMDFYDATSGQDSVISDGYYGMYAMTNHLLQMGHRDIFFVGTLNVTSSISDRYYGYCRAMSEQGLAVTEDMVVPDRDAAGNLGLALPQRLPTAFACNCDVSAYEIVSLLRERGIRVPEDVSIVGFDDYLLSNLSVPAITTYAVDMDGMAKACVDRLQKKIKNQSFVHNLKIVSGRVLIKDSVMRREE